MARYSIDKEHVIALTPPSCRVSLNRKNHSHKLAHPGRVHEVVVVLTIRVDWGCGIRWDCFGNLAVPLRVKSSLVRGLRSIWIFLVVNVVIKRGHVL